ncbi:HTH_Tnp_Tc3_2 domain-containing protein [Trichonephila clavipes]|nr:HTH_Tnp_Tc3_2 domain-containing protein [Trichonephila clavipes]
MALHTEETFNGYGRTTKQQVNTQDTDAPLGRDIDHYGSGGLIVWAEIMLNERTHLHVFGRGSVTAVRLRDEVLEPYDELYTDVVDPVFILIADNARPIELLWSVNFWKMRIFTEWIGLLDLQTSFI